MKIKPLNKKKILYAGPIYFQYDQFLIKKLKELGAEVDIFELFLNSLKFKLTRKFNSSNLDAFKIDYYNKIYSKSNYDFILVRTGHELPSYYFDRLRTLNPNAKFINFHWDSIRPQYDYRHIINSFDKVYSFDPKDCEENNGLNYLPLFYIDEYSTCKNNDTLEKIDLLFIGSWRNQERLNLIMRTKDKCDKMNLKFYHYLYLSLEEQFNYLKKGKIAKHSKPKMLSHYKILKIFSKSNTVIDFPSSFQTGLTMRTFETLGAGKKLITTNKNISREPFYDPDFINIIDPVNLHLDIDFIKRTPEISIKERMKNYSLENYIYNLLK